jgi:hypothetical protein
MNTVDEPESVKLPAGVRDFLKLTGAEAKIQQLSQKRGYWADVSTLPGLIRAWLVLATYQSRFWRSEARRWEAEAQRLEAELEKTPQTRGAEALKFMGDAAQLYQKKRANERAKRKRDKAISPNLDYDWGKHDHTIADFRDATGRTQKTVQGYVKKLAGERTLRSTHYVYTTKGAVTVLDRWLATRSDRQKLATEISQNYDYPPRRMPAELRAVLKKYRANVPLSRATSSPPTPNSTLFGVF